MAKTIAEIHDTRLDKVNSLINEHIDEFEIGIDLLDLMSNENSLNLAKVLGFITNNRQKNCYLLSEQGYMLLVGFMKTEKAKEIRKQLRREYFAMRKVINSSEQLKAQLLLEIYDGGQSGILASKQLTELEKKPLLEKIAEQKPKVNWFDDFLNSNGCYSSNQVAKLFKLGSAQKLNKMLNEKKIIYKKGTDWFPYANINKSWCELKFGVKNGHNYSQLKFTPKGVYEISKLLGIELSKNTIEDLINEDEVK